LHWVPFPAPGGPMKTIRIPTLHKSMVSRF
jgi:hypothetical protein